MGRPFQVSRSRPRRTHPPGAVYPGPWGLTLRRPDGRVVERVRLPVPLIDDIAREAERRGQPFEDVAGDLVAEALPEALREAAEALLAEGRASLTRNTPEPESRGAPDKFFSPTSSTLSIAASAPKQGSDDDATAL